jgi:DNA (cytosine-5)-methyltransferase 1
LSPISRRITLENKYDVIYIDPPWKYGSRGVRSGMYGELDYNSLNIDDIKRMDIPSIANDSCAIFMWFTGSFHREAGLICDHWGFHKQRIDKVWIKKKSKGGRHGVVGPWGMSDAEFLLLATKGNMCSKQTQRNQFVTQECEYPNEHSRKPDIFRKQIEDRFDWAKRIELFARGGYEGWDVWGKDAVDPVNIDMWKEDNMDG